MVYLGYGILALIALIAVFVYIGELSDRDDSYRDQTQSMPPRPTIRRPQRPRAAAGWTRYRPRA